MNRKNNPSTITWILRGAVVLGGLSLAACAPMALPGEYGNQPASANMVVLDQQAVSTAGSTDDNLTPEATNTQVPSETSTATTPEASRTPQPGTTVTAVVGQEVEFTGTIESLDGSTLVVSGRRVILTAQTEVKFQPQKGLNVKVHGTLQADGSVVAREIKSVPGGLATNQPGLTTTPRAEGTRTPQATHQAGETEFYGTVSSISGNVFVVNGIRVVVNGEVKGLIAVGDLVKVHGVIQPDGSVVAREIERADGDDDDSDDDNDGRGGDDDDDNSGPGGDDDDDNSGPGGDDDDDNSGGGDDDDDDNSGDDDDDDDDGNSGGDDDDSKDD